MEADFAELVRANESQVYSLAWHYLRNRPRAEELAQDVFLDLYRNLGAIQSEDHARHWLRVAICRRCLDETRRRRFEPVNGLDHAPEPAGPAEPGDPLLADFLERMVASLGGPARMVMILRYQEDLDPADIAAVLDMPLATVKSHLHRSLEKLREKLTRKGVKA